MSPLMRGRRRCFPAHFPSRRGVFVLRKRMRSSSISSPKRAKRSSRIPPSKCRLPSVKKSGYKQNCKFLFTYYSLFRAEMIETSRNADILQNKFRSISKRKKAACIKRLFLQKINQDSACSAFRARFSLPLQRSLRPCPSWNDRGTKCGYRKPVLCHSS